MKRLSVLVILGLLIISPIYCQTLESGLWQLQNPATINISSLIQFSRGYISNSFLDMNTGQVREARGTYKCSGKTLSIVINNVRYAYNVKWVNQNKLILSNANEKLIYSKSKTAEDTYFKRYMDWYGYQGYSGGSSGGGSYGGDSNTQPKQEICYTCRGGGRCKICSGQGEWQNSFAPFEWHKCSACDGTGKCWHCHGSGIQ